MHHSHSSNTLTRMPASVYPFPPHRRSKPRIALSLCGLPFSSTEANHTRKGQSFIWFMCAASMNFVDPGKFVTFILRVHLFHRHHSLLPAYRMSDLPLPGCRPISVRSPRPRSPSSVPPLPLLPHKVILRLSHPPHRGPFTASTLRNSGIKVSMLSNGTAPNFGPLNTEAVKTLNW